MTDENGQTPETDEEQPFRTIAEIWTAVLKPIPEEWGRPVSMQWAVRIVGEYPGIRFSDMTLFRDLFYAKAQRLADILSDLVIEDEECFKRLDEDEDALLNGDLYRAVLMAWQKEFLTWELRWRTDQESAAVEVASISEIHKMFFGSNGLISLLDSIKLVFTEADRDALVAELSDLKSLVDGNG